MTYIVHIPRTNFDEIFLVNFIHDVKFNHISYFTYIKQVVLGLIGIQRVDYRGIEYKLTFDNEQCYTMFILRYYNND